MNTQIAKDDLLAAIRSAFAGVPRPQCTLDDAELLDCPRAVPPAKDVSLDWCAVADSTLLDCQDGFYFLDADGWQYYLPAAMCAIANDMSDVFSDLAWRLGCLLAPIGDPPWTGTEHFITWQLSRFTLPQLHATRDFLSFLGGRRSPYGNNAYIRALASYWTLRFPSDTQGAHPLSPPTHGT